MSNWDDLDKEFNELMGETEPTPQETESVPMEGVILSQTVVKTPLETALEQLNILEGEYSEAPESLRELERERKILEEKVQQVYQRIQDIKDKRFRLRGDIIRQKEKIATEEHLENERKRVLAQQNERLATYENLREYAKDLNPAWYRYAMKHQWEGALQIALNGSCMLADTMGLGKTLTTIMAADLMKAKKIVVFAPADVTLGFFDEFRMWAPHRNAIPMKSATPAQKKFISQVIKGSKEFTLVLNYEVLWGRGAENKEFLKTLMDAGLDLIVVDEAHNAKNVKGLTFDIVSQLRATAKEIVPISGTFILNSPKDIWPNLYLIDPVAFHDEKVFLRTYCKQNLYTGKWEFRSGGEKSLITALGGRIIRRTLADTDIKLPNQYINEVLIPMSEVSLEQRMIMEQINKHAQIILSQEDANGNPKTMEIAAQIALITRNRQAACYPGGIRIIETDTDENGKKIKGTERVVFDVSEETKESIKLNYAIDKLTIQTKLGKRSVVFSQFKTALAELERRLVAKGVRVARFDGDTKDPDRQRIKKDFLRPSDGIRKSEYEYDVVLANFKTGGVGLNFTEATYMLMLDEDWNPGKNEQAYARINRIGQTEENQVDILRLDESIDMWMKSLNETKKAISDGFEGEIDMQRSLYELITEGKTQVSLESVKVVSDESMDADVDA